MNGGLPRTTRVRAAFVGSGFMGRMHARAALANGAELSAVVGRDASSAARAADALGAERGWPNLDALLAADPPDVLHICSPNATHVAYARAAIEAGVHVVCEKPLATDAKHAHELADLAERAGIVASVPFVYRFHPMVREARARIADGAIGEVIGVQGAYLQDWLLSSADDDWRVDATQGGPSRAFADIGSHLVDLVEFISGDRVRRLVAVTSVVHARRGGRDVDTEDAAAVVIELEGGAIGTLDVSQVFAGRKNDLSVGIAGSLASIRFVQERPDELVVGGQGTSSVVPRDGRLAPDAARLSTVPAGHPMGYADAFIGYVGDVYAAMRGETREGLPTFRDGARAAEVTAAVLRSAEHRRWMELPITRGMDDDRNDASRNALHRAVG